VSPVVNRLIVEGRLSRIDRDQQLIDHLLVQARLHIESAELLLKSDDLIAAHLVAYDAVRKSCTALLASQGLRPTSRGGHHALFECIAEVSAELHEYFPDLDTLRRQRNSYEYPSFAGHAPTELLLTQSIALVKFVLLTVNIIL